jgi:hypothetical protein
MDREEIKATIKDVISNLVKDNIEGAQQGIHDVLAAKMRERINPSPVNNDDPAGDHTDDDPVDDDSTDDPVDDPTDNLENE